MKKCGMEKWQTRYWTIFAGQSVSLIGSGVTQFILVWWVATTYGTISSVAVAGIVVLLPQALLAPLGGVLADRYKRQTIIILSDVFSALVIVGIIILFVLDDVALWHLYLGMFLRSCMQALQGPAVAASVAMLVPSSFLPRAAGYQQTVQGLMTIGSAPIGALAIATLPIEMALAIDVVTALLAIIPLLIFTIPQRFAGGAKTSSVLGNFTDGLKELFQRPGLWRLYVLIGVVSLTIAPAFILLPLLVIQHFSGGAYEVALMEGLTGVAMMIGGAAISYIAPRRSIVWVLSGLALSCIGIALAGLVPPDAFWLSLLAWTASGFFFSMGNAPLMALLQMTIPNELQGRLISLLNTTMGLAAPIGLLLATPLGEILSVRWLFVSMGLIGCGVCLCGFFASSIRALGGSYVGAKTEAAVCRPVP